VAQEVRALHRAHFARPDFGVQFTVEAEMPSLAALAIPRVDEDVEIFDEVGLSRGISDPKSCTLMASFAPLTRRSLSLSLSPSFVTRPPLSPCA
jgi:hypothetical protein